MEKIRNDFSNTLDELFKSHIKQISDLLTQANGDVGLISNNQLNIIIKINKLLFVFILYYKVDMRAVQYIDVEKNVLSDSHSYNLTKIVLPRIEISKQNSIDSDDYLYMVDIQNKILKDCYEPTKDELTHLNKLYKKYHNF